MEPQAGYPNTLSLENMFLTIIKLLEQNGPGSRGPQVQVPGSVAKSAEESLEAADPNIRAFEEIYRRQRLSTQEQQKSPTEVNREYYEEYCKIYLANTILLEKVKEVVEQKEELIQKMKKIQNAAHQILSSLNTKQLGKRKRVRRKANEIERPFKCPIPRCKKSYGSEGSLHQHLKKKHKKFFVKYCLQHKILLDSQGNPIVEDPREDLAPLPEKKVKASGA